MTPITLGITRFLQLSPPKSQVTKPAVGLLSHVNIFDEEDVPTYERLMASDRVDIKAFFGPQHGFFMDTFHAQMVPTPSSVHPTYKIPIHSLYRDESRDVDPDLLSGLDMVLVDLQDVGVKVYTYIWSMTKLMQACAKAKVKAVILDRPNPISGLDVQGPITQEAYTSFIGLFPIAFCHGMTMGEIAKYLNETFNFQCELEVVPMEGWHRNSFWDDYELTWHPPSPNLRTLEAAIHYPATVMIEATQVSEGRGTEQPFCMMGAPYIESKELIAMVNQSPCKGYRLHPVLFTPTADKYQGEECHGVRLEVTDRDTYNPVLLGCVMIQTLKQMYGKFAFREPPYEYETQKNPFDITVGDPKLRELLLSPISFQDLAAIIQHDADVFKQKAKPYLIYED